jgi:hypothetical protein
MVQKLLQSKNHRFLGLQYHKEELKSPTISGDSVPSDYPLYSLRNWGNYWIFWIV